MIKHTKIFSLLGILAALVTFMFLRTGGANAAPAIRIKAWNVIASPNVRSDDNYLQGVAAITAGDLWAVGYSSANSGAAQALIEHWDGSQWSIISSPQPNGWTSGLAAVTAISSNSVWAVGSYTSNTGTFILIEHWDGTQWSIVSGPNPGTYSNNLSSVVAITGNDVWAVGSFTLSNSSSYQTLTEHWDGTQWSIVPSPNAGSSGLSSVAAISTTDVWAAGGGNGRGLVEHWNGTRWSIVLNTTGSQFFTAISVLPSGDAWVVGFVLVNGNQRTTTERWDGRKWNNVSSPIIPNKLNEFLGVTAISSHSIWAVGYADPDTLIEYWDGSNWSIVSSPDGGPMQNFLLSVTSVLHTEQALAVGHYYAPNNNPETIGTAQTLVETYP